MGIPGIETVRAHQFITWGAANAAPVAFATALAAAGAPASAAEPIAAQAAPQRQAAADSTDATPSADPFEQDKLVAASPDPDSRSKGRIVGSGSASYYGASFAGRRTASGERFDPRVFTAAHRTLPFGSRVKVTNQRNGKSVVVRINDRGPFHRDRVIDLSHGAARKIGIVAQGKGWVELALLDD